MSTEPVFDWSRVPAEDMVVRTVATVDGEERWVDVLVAASGRRALCNWSGFEDAEEAIAWVKTFSV